MSRFIRTFVGDSVSELAEAANCLAEKEKLLIISAGISFSGSGRTYELPVLTVVFERTAAKPRKAKRTTEGGGEDA